ncbi:MAG: hypothetical protein ACREOM_03180 [Candidatus Dormibacteraceae bacterium]
MGGWAAGAAESPMWIRGAHDGISTGEPQSTSPSGAGAAVAGGAGAHAGREATGCAGATGSAGGAGGCTGGVEAAVGGALETGGGDSTLGVATGPAGSGAVIGAGGGVAGCEAVAAGIGPGGTVAGGTVAGGTVAGGTVAGSAAAAAACGGAVTGLDVVEEDRMAAGCGWIEPAAGEAVAGEASNESGQLGITASGMSEGVPCCVIFADGGQAGMACSVGGSGGQMSVSAGGAVSFSSAGGHVLLAESPATALGVSVKAAVVAGTAPALASSAAVGTVWAQTGAGFCMGTAVLGPVVGAALPAASGSAPASPCVQAGSPFCIGLAGKASPSPAVLMASAPSAGGTTGTVRAQTGTVSLVETAGTGSSSEGLVSGGDDFCGISGGCESKTRSV